VVKKQEKTKFGSGPGSYL